MRAYLEVAGVGGILAQIDQRPEIITLDRGSPNVVMYLPDTHTIRIDPLSGNQVDGGAIQSPALGFLHEAAHALQHLKDPERFDTDRRPRSDPQYGTKEERRVIEKVEAPAAVRLGEPVRRSHNENPVQVRCPTCRE